MYGSPTDFGFLSPQFKGDVQLFFANGTTPASQAWQIWQKPRGISMVYMLAISGGGGGGGGCSNSPGANKGGGGGGGCSGITSMMMPAIFLPDQLYIFAGNGGIGGATGVSGGTGTNGGSGTVSIISLGNGSGAAGATIPNQILQSGVAGPTGGGGGPVNRAANGGAAGTVSTIATTGPLGKLGFFTSTGTDANNGYVGLAGTNGGGPNNTGGNVINTWSILPLSPGAGGGGGGSSGIGQLGGQISFVAPLYSPEFMIQSLQPGNAGSPGPAGDGANGVSLFKPFFQTGGCGGGSSALFGGGIGGNGGIGCGGGGGGAGVTGGKGGNGGSGMVAMICW